MKKKEMIRPWAPTPESPPKCPSGKLLALFLRLFVVSNCWQNHHALRLLPTPSSAGDRAEGAHKLGYSATELHPLVTGL